MKSYLSLIPISAKVRKRQNRMTLFCVIISVFFVTAIFSITDMMIRTETGFMINNHGNWHIALKNISQDNADEVGGRPDVAAVGAASSFNLDGRCRTGSMKKGLLCMARMKHISVRFRMELRRALSR